MNYKLEKFWNRDIICTLSPSQSMNCKLEKFWNLYLFTNTLSSGYMNCKLEKFWNGKATLSGPTTEEWTINLKSFEI